MLTTRQVLCSVPYLRRNNSKHTEIFSAEDIKMNESKYIIIICKTCILIGNMIRIPPVHNSENQQSLQRGPSVFPEGDWDITVNVRWQHLGLVHTLSQVAATEQGFSISAA